MKHSDPAGSNVAPATVTDLRKALEAKRDELVRIHFRLEEIAAKRELGSMGSRVTADERKLAEERLSNNAFVLHQIWDALDRISAGLYGTCLNCGQPIGAKRLTALPWATLCQMCQVAAESRSAAAHSTICLAP